MIQWIWAQRQVDNTQRLPKHAHTHTLRDICTKHKQISPLVLHAQLKSISQMKMWFLGFSHCKLHIKYETATVLMAQRNQSAICADSRIYCGAYMACYKWAHTHKRNILLLTALLYITQMMNILFIIITQKHGVSSSPTSCHTLSSMIFFDLRRSHWAGYIALA